MNSETTGPRLTVPRAAACWLLKTALPGWGAGCGVLLVTKPAVQVVIQFPQIAMVFFPSHDVAGTAQHVPLLRLDDQPRDGAAGRVEFQAVTIVFQNRLVRRLGNGGRGRPQRQQAVDGISQGRNIAGHEGNLGPQQAAVGGSHAIEQLDRRRLPVGTDQGHVHDVAVGKADLRDGDIRARPPQHVPHRDGDALALRVDRSRGLRNRAWASSLAMRCEKS